MTISGTPSPILPVNAAKAGAGDSLLALPGTATPQPGAGAATPFAQMLDGATAQLPTATQDATPSVPALAQMAERLPEMPAALPFRPMPMAVRPAPAMPEATMPGRVPTLAPGKTLPPAAVPGTALPPVLTRPGEAVEEEPEAGLTVIEPSVAAAAQAAPVDPLAPVPVPVPVPALAPALPLPASPAAVPFVAAQTARPAEAATTTRPTPAAVAAASTAVPAVTLVAADLPAMANGSLAERPAAAPLPATRPVQASFLDFSSAAQPAEPAVISAAPQPLPMPMQDLTQIVERLAAAREAVAPAATRLAVDHAEFGPLQLSIEQGGGGTLAIEVAAADPGSQAALVAAMAQADLPHFDTAPERRDTAPERDTSTGQPGEGRGQPQGRDRFAGQSQPQQQRFGQQRRDQPPAAGQGEARSGTYA